MEMHLPIRRYTSSRTRGWLVERVVEGRRETRALDVVVGPVVVEPVLARLVTRDHWMIGFVSMMGRVL